MACHFCRHYETQDRSWNHGQSAIENVRQEKGTCTLSPDWREVSGLHYCSQFSPREASLIGIWWAGMHERNVEARGERGRRREAEAKLKELRAKLRALKAPATVAGRHDAGGEDR